MPQTYKEYQPTGWDSPSNFVSLEDINYLKEWLVCPTGRNRDSSLLDESNFEAALELLGGKSDKVEVHRFGHWACGWYELILVHPDLKDKVEHIEKCLNNYLLLNEDGYSDKSFESACELWANSNLRDRLDLLESYGDRHSSIFRIRRDSLPDSIDTWLMCP